MSSFKKFFSVTETILSSSHTYLQGQSDVWRTSCGLMEITKNMKNIYILMITNYFLIDLMYFKKQILKF